MQAARADPWGEGATTLEWTRSSPPPFHQFPVADILMEAAMNETADAATNFPTILLLSFWWAFLYALELLARLRVSGTIDQPRTHLPDCTSIHADETGFPELRELDPEFRAGAFLEGARRAYEAVLDAYARGDIEALRPLLSADVLQAFAEAGAARSGKGEALEMSFIGFESSEIASVDASPAAIEIAVLFRALVVSSEHSAAGEVIRGDPASVALTSDLWTFTRPVTAESHAWVIMATDQGPA